MVTFNKKHVSELVKKTWVSPEGDILPDYAYPLVKSLKKNLEDNPNKSIAELCDLKYVDAETREETLHLLAERLKLLNGGTSTTSLLVLPSNEYQILHEGGVYVFPERTSLAGTAGEQKEAESEDRLVLVFLQQVRKIFEVEQIDYQKLEPDVRKEIKKQNRLRAVGELAPATTAVVGAIGIPAFPFMIHSYDYLVNNPGTQPLLMIPGAIIAAVSTIAFAITNSRAANNALNSKEYQEKLRQEHEEQTMLMTSYLLQTSPAIDAKGNVTVVQETLKRGRRVR